MRHLGGAGRAILRVLGGPVTEDDDDDATTLRRIGPDELSTDTAQTAGTLDSPPAG